jgi:tRNA C32,U32 (ribose-2'-O)-methylase TrmJ
MEKNKRSSRLEDEDTKKVYDEFYEHAMHLMNDHQQPLELVAGTMIAIAQRMYKTQLSEEEYNDMMDVIRDAPVKPYNVKKVRLQ